MHYKPEKNLSQLSNMLQLTWLQPVILRIQIATQLREDKTLEPQRPSLA